MTSWKLSCLAGCTPMSLRACRPERSTTVGLRGPQRRRAGLPGFRFHDPRHTCASHLTMKGRPLKEIQEVLGHKSFSTTLRYAHLSPMHLRTAVESLDGLMPSIDKAEQMAHNMAQNEELERLPLLSD